MANAIKVALAGAGAFGIRHLDGIKNIDGIEVVSLVSRELDKTKEVADKHGIGHVSTELADSLALPGVDAVILCTPTQMHAAQAIACMKAGKHVQVEIPLADSLRDAYAVVATQEQTGLVAMCGHTRRFNPSHQFVRKKITAGELMAREATQSVRSPSVVATARSSSRVPFSTITTRVAGSAPAASRLRRRSGALPRPM